MGNALALVTTCLPNQDQTPPKQQAESQQKEEIEENEEIEDWQQFDSFENEEQTDHKQPKLTTQTLINPNTDPLPPTKSSSLALHSSPKKEPQKTTENLASPSKEKMQSPSSPPVNSNSNTNNNNNNNNNHHTSTAQVTEPKEDFFLDMEPVYKAPKKLEIEKPSNSRLKMNQEENVDNSEGWGDEEMNI